MELLQYVCQRQGEFLNKYNVLTHPQFGFWLKVITSDAITQFFRYCKSFSR